MMKAGAEIGGGERVYMYVFENGLTVSHAHTPPNRAFPYKVS